MAVRLTGHYICYNIVTRLREKQSKTQRFESEENTMTAINTFDHQITINARKNKSEAFQKVCDLMFVDASSKKYSLNGSLNFSRIAPDFELQAVECTGNSRKHCFSFETNGKAITEVVEALAAMLPEIEIDYIFHSTDENDVEYMHELFYENGELADESVTDFEEYDEEEWF